MPDQERQDVEFDHVGLNVPDLEEGISWYCETFDLKSDPVFAIPNTDMHGVMLLHEPSGYRIELLNRPGAQIGMQPGSAEEAPLTLGFSHFCIRVKDVAQEYERLMAAGCSSLKTPMTSPRGTQVSFVADPWGNMIEVITTRD
jgi:catechol 2,3-dioxygenase-like lactoylglutathione lyase family enzyme